MIAAPIVEYLRRHDVPFVTVSHRLAFTAQEEAAVTHVPGRSWAKVVVCVIDAEPVLAVLPAHFRLDVELLRRLAGGFTARLATEREFAHLYPGCELGAMPPFGPLWGQRVFVDDSLARDQEVVFNGGTHTDAIRMRYADFVTLVQPVVGEFAFGPGHLVH